MDNEEKVSFSTWFFEQGGWKKKGWQIFVGIFFCTLVTIVVPLEWDKVSFHLDDKIINILYFVASYGFTAGMIYLCIDTYKIDTQIK